MIYEERAYQTDVVNEALAQFLNERSPSVLVEAPVGSGKTIMALRIIDGLEKSMNRRLRIDWVAPRHHLLEQVMEANRDFLQARIRPVSLFEKTPPPADIVVLDEAHHEATKSCVMLYEHINAPLTLGLSATPMRTDRMRLSFKSTVNSCGIARLIREGYLSPYHAYGIPHYDWRTVAQLFLRDRERWGKTVVFFDTIEHCGNFRDAVFSEGIACEVVTGESDKDAQIEAFRSGQTDVVANVQMLSEGFDLPDLQTVFVRDASRLPTIQMCGRGLRKSDGKNHCNIIQSQNTKFAFERIAPPENAFRLMNGIWLSLTDKTREIELAMAETMRRIAANELRAREAKASAQRETVSRFFADEPPPNGDGSMLNSLYRRFYLVYDMLNAVCWENRLPRVKLILDFKLAGKRGSMTMGYAKRGSRSDETSGTGSIRLYLRRMMYISKNSSPESGISSTLLLLAHEMTHIWQFANGKRGGHGKDFRREMERIGNDEIRRNVPPDSPMSQAIRLTVERHLSLWSDMKSVNHSNYIPNADRFANAYWRNH